MISLSYPHSVLWGQPDAPRSSWTHIYGSCCVAFLSQHCARLGCDNCVTCWLDVTLICDWHKMSPELWAHVHPPQTTGLELNVWVCLWALGHLQSTAAGWEVVAGVLMCPPVTRISSLLWVCDICEELIWRWRLLHFSMGPSDKCSLSFSVMFIPYINGTTLLALKMASSAVLSSGGSMWNAGCSQHGESSHSKNAVITFWGAQERT